MVSVEIGHGSVLIRHPSSFVREEESEASSHSVDNKQYTLTSRDMSFRGRIEDTGAYSSSKVNEKLKKNAYPGVVQEHMRRYFYQSLILMSSLGIIGSIIFQLQIP